MFASEAEARIPDELMKERTAIKKRREAQTEEEKQVELTANSIRNTIAQKMMGPRKRGGITIIEGRALSFQFNGRMQA